MFFFENFNFLSPKVTSREGSEEKPDRIIEIQQGCIKNLIHISKSLKNDPEFSFWRDWRFVGMLFLDYFFFRLANLMYLTAFIIILAIGDTETTIMPSVLVFFFFPFYLLSRWLVESQRQRQLKLQSSCIIKKIAFNSHDFYKDCKCSEVVVGDIILLLRNENFPADILLLDCENEDCLLDTHLVDGKSDTVKKKAIKLTRISKYSPFKGKLEEYKKILTGKFQYDPPSSDPDYFKGTLKLKKDPISEELSIHNFCPKGSILAYSDWIIGLVVYIGSEVKIAEKRNISYQFQNDFLRDFLNKLNIMSLALILIIFLIILIRISSNNEMFHQIFQDNTMEILSVNLVTLIPTNVLPLIESLLLFYKYKLEKKYKGEISIQNPFKLPYLSQITHLICDKGTILEKDRSTVHSVYLPNNRNFFLTPNFSKKKQKQKSNVLKLSSTLRQKSIKNNEISRIRDIKEPKIVLPTSFVDDSPKFKVPEDGWLSIMPSKIKYKFSPTEKENEHSNSDSNSQSFQGQGEAKSAKNYKNEKDVLVTLGKKELQDEIIATISNKYNDFSKSPISELVSPGLLHNSTNTEINELDRWGNLKEVLRDDINIPNSNCHEIFKALLLANQVRSKRIEKENDKYLNEFLVPDSETLLNFLEEHNYSFLYQCTILNNLIKCYNVSINGKQSQFYILGSEFLNPISKNCSHYSFSILIKPAVSMPEHMNGNISDDSPILYIKSSCKDFLDMLDVEEVEKELLKMKLEIMKSNGLRFVFLAQRKHLSEEDVVNYLTHIRDPTKEYSLPRNCELLCVVGIRDKVKKGVKQLVRDFLSIDNKVWLLSNDSEDHLVSSGHLLGLMSKDKETMRLILSSDNYNVNEAWIKIRMLISKMKRMLPDIQAQNSPQSPSKARKSMFEKNDINRIKYNLLIDGKTLSIVRKDPDLLNHFIFIVNFSESLIGSGLSGQDKGFLVDLLKKNFPNQPVIMTIGEGFDDSLMSRNAHISISMKSNETTNKAPNPHYGQFNVSPSTDLSISNFKLLRVLLRIKSLALIRRVFTIVLFCYSASFLYMLPSAYYMLFFGVLTGQLIEPYLFIIKDVVILNIICILYFFWGSKYQTKILKSFVWTYQDGRNSKEGIYWNAFWRVYINAILDSLFVICFVVYGPHLRSMGNICLFEEFSAMLYTTVVFMVFVKNIFFFKRPSVILIILLLIGISLHYIIAILNNIINVKPLNWSMLNAILELSENPETLLLLNFNILFQLIRSQFNQTFIYQRFFIGNYGKIKRYLSEGGDFETLRKTELPKMIRKSASDLNLKNVTEAVRKIFKYKHMDILVQEMLNPTDVTVNERGYHLATLKFKDAELESQYLKQITKFSFNKKKKIINLSLIQYFILDLLLLLITYRNNQPEHAPIALAFTVYTFALIINRFLLNFENLAFPYKICRIMVPLSNICFCIILMVYSQNSVFHSIIMIYVLILSMYIQSEFIEAFIHYSLLCILFLALYLHKVNNPPHQFVMANLSESPSETSQLVSMILECLVIICYEIYTKYKKEQTYRDIFLNERAIKQENKKIGELLSILVPSFVKESLIQGVHSLSEDQGDVTILFCDICNFDKIVKIEQQGVIRILDNLYRMFDTFCLENDIQKIETVGKTYMACAGLKAVESTLQVVKNKNSTQRIINLALNMMNYTKRLNWGNNENICIKIGIHYGPVLAGVIGYHKPQFSLIGDTVNTTSRVCSTGDESTITISKAGFDNIHGYFKSLEFRERVVEAKGKGLLVTYQIKEKKNQKGNTLITSFPKDRKEKGKNIELQEEKEGLSLNEELINMAKDIRKNIKRTTMMRGIGKTMIVNSPKDNKEFKFSNKSQKELSNHNFTNFDLDYIDANKANNVQNAENKSDALSFNRIGSEIKGYFDDISTFEKKQHSFLKLTSNISKSEKDNRGLNIIHFIENEHLKALNSNRELIIDKIENIESYPGQYNSKNDDFSMKKSAENNNNNNDDDFFDKLNVKENSLEVLIYNEYWLHLGKTNPLVLQEFMENQRETNFKENLTSLFVLGLIYLINTFLLILKTKIIDNFIPLLISRLIINSMNFLTFFGLKNRRISASFMRKLLVLLVGLTATELLAEYLVTNYMGMENSIEIILFYMISINFSYLLFLDSFFLCVYISIFLLLELTKLPTLEFFTSIALLLCSLVVILNNLRVKKLNTFKNFNTLRVNTAKKNQQKNLIVNLLPTHILEKFLRNPNQKITVTDEFSDVTILFADIAGFTKYSSTVSPTQVVAVLKDLFTEFDKLCLENCVYKLYTIGDCYVVLGLIDAEERNPELEALNVVNMGFQMIEKIKEVKKRVSFHDIDMRIGIHTGKIIGGVIGTDIVRYDVYGKDVAIANKMESNGIEGNITVSDATREVLMKQFSADFVFAFHKEVFLPSFNETVNCFKVIDVRNDS